jgi:hypothetical protein
MAECTLEDQIRNTVIRKKLNILNIIQNNRLNWIHRARRTEPEPIPKQLMGNTPRGTRHAKRPKGQPVLQRNLNDHKVQTLMIIKMMMIYFYVTLTVIRGSPILVPNGYTELFP